MRKLNIKELVKFKRSTDRVKQNFALNLKLNKAKVETDSDSRGDYWVTSTSAIINSFKAKDLQFIRDKKSELEAKYEAVTVKKSKDMYERNIKILYGFEDIDSNGWRPDSKIKFLPQPRRNQVVTIDGLQLQLIPSCVFEFDKDGQKEIGAVWFIAQKDGFSKVELGMFVDMLWRYLNTYFAKDHVINLQYCIAVDTCKGQSINYLQLTENGVPMILDSTIQEIKKLM